MSIRVSHIRDIFNPHPEPPVLLEYRPGLLVRDCAPAGFDLEGGHLVLLNNQDLEGWEVESLEVRDGDVLIFGERPGIAAAIGLSGIAATVMDTLVMVTIGLAASFGIAALGGPKKLPNSDYGDQSDGPARNFEGIQDTSGPGRPIPFVYGQVRTGGQFLQSFERAISGEQVRDGLTTLHTLMGICLGPIESITDIQINGNDLDTIEGVTYETRLGTSDQAPCNGFGEIAHEIVHERPLLESEGWTTFLTTRAVNALEITFRFPQGLFRVSSSGQVIQADVTFEIEAKAYGVGQTYLPVLATKTVSASGRNPIKGQVKLEGLPLAQYEVRIRRVTVDDEDRAAELEYSSSSEVYAISEITYEAQAHPGLALAAFRQIPSEQLNSSVPTTYTYLVKGFKDIRIYSNPSTYTVGWSDNPAWCCAHFLTSALHGLGDKYTWDDIDIDDFLAWAIYCDTLVDRGDGFLEKRCTFNHVFDSKISAEDALEVFCQGTGAFLVKRGSQWRVVLDAPAEMVWVATEGNIIPGTLIYSFLPIQQLANRLQLTFADEANDYERDVYPDEDPDLLPGDKYIEAERELWGVTRVSQVAREARRILLHNKCDTTQVELEAGLDAIIVTAGSVFGVATPKIAVGIASGRLLTVDSTGTLLTLDEEVTLEEGQTYEIVVSHATGGITSKRIVSPAGKYETIAAADPTWTGGTIAAGDVYTLGLVEYAVEKYRCIETSLSGYFRRRIRGLRYDETVYTFNLEEIPNTIPPSIPDPRLVPPDGTDLTLTERQEYQQDGTMLEVIDVDWTAPISAILEHFEIWMRASDSANWILRGSSTVGHYTIRDGILTPGYVYEVAIVSVSANGQRKAPGDSVQASIMTTGVLTQPPTPTNMMARLIDGTLVITVDPISDEDLGPSGYYEWRLGSAWNQSLLLDTTQGPRLEVRSYSHGAATILVKAVNSIGNKSPQPASTTITLYGQFDENVVIVQTEAPGWSGTRIGFTIEGGTNKLSLVQPPSSTTMFRRRRRTRRSSRGGGWGAPDPVPQSVPEGWYTSGILTVSSGSLVTARPDVFIDWEAIYLGLGVFDTANFSFDSAEAQVPYEGDPSEAQIAIEVQSRYSTTTTSEGAFTAWADHRDRGEISMRYFQYRIRATCGSAAYSLKISDLTLTIDLPDKTTSGQVSVLIANPVTTTYPVGYFVAVKRLIATLIGGAVGDSLRITAQDATGFTAEIRTSAGALTTGSFHYEARGY